MKLLKSLPAVAAAASLAIAQPALALATPDNDVPVDEIGAPRPAEPLVFFMLIAAVAIGVALIVGEHGRHEVPVSP